MKEVTVKELRDALADMPDDAQIQIEISQYHKTGHIFLPLEKSVWHKSALKEIHGNVVRLFSSLPQTDTTFSFIVTKKK